MSEQPNPISAEPAGLPPPDAPQDAPPVDARLVEPVVAEPPASAPPAAADAALPGPITLRTHAFFDADVDAADAPIVAAPTSRATPAPAKPSPPSRLDRQIEVSGGIIVVERASRAWMVTAAAVVAGLSLALLLDVDRGAARDALKKSEGDIKALEARLDEAQSAVAEARVAASATAVAASAPAAADAAKTAPLVTLLEATLNKELKKELARGDAKIEIKGKGVTLVVAGGALFDGKRSALTRRGEETLARVAAAINHPTSAGARVDVIAHTDATAGRGESEFGQSAARATSVVRYFAERARVDGKRLWATGRGAAEPVGRSAAANRRVEIVITPD